MCQSPGSASIFGSSFCQSFSRSLSPERIMLVDQIEPSLGEVIIVSYEGEYNSESGAFEGRGVAVLDNECKYEGHFKNGMFSGKGVFAWPRGVKFEGDFEAGQILGKGTYEWSDGSIYAGDVLNGLRHGAGKFTGSSGQVYEGEWELGKRHGKGKIWYNEDRTVTYTGDWVRNLRDGYGSMKYASGNSYEGEWKDDKKSGTGLMVWRDVDEVYSGRWQLDLPHGLGEHIWGDSASHSVRKETCNIYRGNFVQGRREGRGTFFYMNGSQYTGEWAADLKQGEGLFFYADGRIFGGSFHQNRMITDYAKEESSAPRATEAVNPQFKLNIADLFDFYPHLLESATPTPPSKTGAVKIGSFAAMKATSTTADKRALEVKEMERLLLKYNHYLRNALRRYTDFANKRRLGEALRAHQLLASWTPTDTLHRLHKTCATARIFQKRMFCMNLEQMLRFLRECGVVGPFFRSYDLSQCLAQLKSEREIACVDKLREYSQTRKQALAGGPSAEAKEEQGHGQGETVEELMRYLDLEVPSIMDGYLHPHARQPAAFRSLSGQPILEREFVELFVRALATKYARAKNISPRYSDEAAAVAGMSLTQLLYYFLAHKLMPLVSDFEEHVPAFVREFYYEEVQTLLYSNEVPAAQKGFDLDEPKHAAQGPETDAATAPAAAAFDASTGKAQLTFFEKLWAHLKRVSAGAGSARSDESETVDLAEALYCGQPLGALHAAGPPALNGNPTGGSVPLKVLVDFLLTLRGAALADNVTSFTVLMAMEAAPPSSSAPNPLPVDPAPTAETPLQDGEEGIVSVPVEVPVEGDAENAPKVTPVAEGPKFNPRDFDLTCVQTRIDFHDCLELICRVASSPLNVWALSAPPPADGALPVGRSSSSRPNTGADSRAVKAVVGEGDDDSVSVYSVSIADILAERIGLWKQTFNVDAMLV